MATQLVAALLVLLVLMVWPGNIAHLRRFGWYERWLVALDFAEGGGRVALALVVPIVLCAVIVHFLRGWALLPVAFVFAVVVLAYAAGPRELDGDFNAVLKCTDPAARVTAASELRSEPDGAPRAFTAPELVEAAVMAGLRRRFAVLFWFFLLGPAGALGYRLAWVTTGTADPRTRAAARRFALALDWVPAHLMVFAMALVSNFDAVMRTWRAWHREPNRTLSDFDTGFLTVAARAGVNADVVAGDDASTDIRDPVNELADTRRLLLRMLIVWLAVVALIVLAGWAA